MTSERGELGEISEVVRHVVASIGPASDAHASAVQRRFSPESRVLHPLAGRLAGAQHGRPRNARRYAVVVAADDDSPGPRALAAEHPTAVAAAAIATGRDPTALDELARVAHTPVVVVDAAMRTPLAPPAVRLDLGSGGGLDAGIALAISLAEAGDGLDVIALGALGRWSRGSGADVLAGLILAAASMSAAIILDGDATGAAALAAVALQPHAAGYLIAAHARNAHLVALGLAPMFDTGLGHGEGAGAVMLLPFVDEVVRSAKLD